MISFSKYTDIVSKIAKKLNVSKDVALAVLQKAQEKGIDPIKWAAHITMLNNFVRIVAEYEPAIEEEIEVGNVLKWILSGKTLSDAKKMRDKVIKENPKYKPISDKDLHITLASGSKWKKMKEELKDTPLPDPTFRMDFGEPKLIEASGRASWYIKIRQQQELKEYVIDLLQGSPDSKRIFHVSLANLTGKVGDSVAMAEESKRDYRAEYDKFQSSTKRKKYRAELNKYNRQKGTYGNKDKKDASHKNGKIVGFEDEGENRGRSEKSRIKGSVRKPFNEKKYKQNK